MKIKTEDAPEYLPATAKALTDDQIVQKALQILSKRLRKPGATLTSPESTRAFLALQLALEEREVFACLFLDNRHLVIAYEELFFGTVDGASVHPREVVKAALRLNAVAVIFAHNHPSGVAEPSRADIQITGRLRDALALVEVRVLDHLIIGGEESTSLAEQGHL